MIVNYESLQQHEGGTLGLQLLVDKEGYDLAGQFTEAMNKSHSPALAALAVLKGTVQLPELFKNRTWLDSKTVRLLISESYQYHSDARHGLVGFQYSLGVQK